MNEKMKWWLVINRVLFEKMFINSINHFILR